MDSEIEGNKKPEVSVSGRLKEDNQRGIKNYLNFKAVATTLRQVKIVTADDWSTICWAAHDVFASTTPRVLLWLLNKKEVKVIMGGVGA